jgi:hypothetical protein
VRFRSGRLAALALVLLLVAALAVHDDRRYPAVAELADGPFASPAVGVQFHGTWAELSGRDQDRILDAMSAAGVRWVRIDVAWSMIAPKRGGEYDERWGVPQVSRAIGKARARGLNVLGMFWSTPDWANDGAGRRVLPSDPHDYAAALDWAARRWAGQVQAWEVWNEPNSSEFLQPPDARAYTRLLVTAYDQLKLARIDTPVVFGGTRYVDTAWIARAYAAGAGRHFDVMAVHPYQGVASLPPEAPATGDPERLEHTAALVTEMRAHGDGGTPIWFTEFGWSAHANPVGTPVWFRGVSEATQADYLRRTLVLLRTRYPQVTNVFWYTSRDLVTGKLHPDHRGLLRRDFTPRPALAVVRCYVQGCGARAPARGGTR